VFSASFAWRERHSVSTGRSRGHAITSAAFRDQPLCCADIAPQSDRSAKTKREPVGLTISPPRATIMRVAARHEAESKIDVQYYWTWRRCRWPTQWACPRALLEVAALGEKA